MDGSKKKQREASGFSLFVKDNYSKVKRGDIEMTHVETMRELSLRYKLESKAAKPNTQQLEDRSAAEGQLDTVQGGETQGLESLMADLTDLTVSAAVPSFQVTDLT